MERSLMRRVFVGAVIGVLVVGVAGVADAKPSFGPSCAGCHATVGGALEISPDPIAIVVGDSGQVTFNITDIPAADAAIALYGLDAPGLGATVGAGWTDYGTYYATGLISVTGPYLLDLAIDPGATFGDYGIAVILAGSGGWADSYDFVVRSIPEPSTVVLLLTGLSAMGLCLWRRRSKVVG